MVWEAVLRHGVVNVEEVALIKQSGRQEGYLPPRGQRLKNYSALPDQASSLTKT
jgi:hypothetical protein